jgi:hypothetical protein
VVSRNEWPRALLKLASVKKSPALRCLSLRPCVKNPLLWFPERLERRLWNQIRERVLTRDRHSCRFCGHNADKFMHVHHLDGSDDNSLRNLATCCVACHAVNHFGNNLRLGTIELWSSPIPQVEIVRASRAGIRAGKTLDEINRSFELYRGPIPPIPLMQFMDRELRRRPRQHTFALAEPLSAVFVDFKQWQIE